MAEYIKREAAIAYIREQSEECQKAFEEFGGESGIYADAYNDLAEDFYSIPAADVAPVVYGRWGTGRFNLETGNYEEQCIRCRNFSKEYGKPYCPNCGAKMDGGKS
jgi:hypothetical protein|nr:MAG TPA: Putative toxin VapC6 domain, ZN ribbon domain [Caudoviricetes sp.]